MSAGVAKWLSSIENLPQIHKRLQRVQIECVDFRRCIATYDTTDTFFYLDPPYPASTRRDSSYYSHEMTDADHAELVELLLKIQGKALLSGYANLLYQPLERAGWLRTDYKTACHAVARTRLTGILGNDAALEKQPRVESLWQNYQTQIELF
jgi:DNA adenine methylase